MKDLEAKRRRRSPSSVQVNENCEAKSWNRQEIAGSMESNILTASDVRCCITKLCQPATSEHIGVLQPHQHLEKSDGPRGRTEHLLSLRREFSRLYSYSTFSICPSGTCLPLLRWGAAPRRRRREC
ncbi:uncharacterized protein AAES06_022023 [Glossophaga mutica]